MEKISQDLIDYWIEAFEEISAKTSGLAVNIYIDDSNICKRHGFPLVVFVTNGYDYYAWDNNFLAITIEEEPKIISDVEIGLFREDLIDIIEYIKTKRYQLISMSKGRFDFADFILNHANINESESASSLNEMCKMSSSLTGLPLDIWVDTNKLYKKHGSGGYRIKVQPKDGDDNPRNWPSLTFDDYRIIDRNNKYSKKELDKLYRFINANEVMLKKLADNEIDYNEFLKRCYMFDEFGNIKISPIHEGYVFYKRLCDGYSIVINKAKTKYNIRNDMRNRLLFDEWFDSIDVRARDYRGEKCYFATDGDKIYYITLTGRIYKRN